MTDECRRKSAVKAADFLYIIILQRLGDLMYPYIRIFGLVIPSYGVCACLAVFLCAAFLFATARKNGMDFNDLLILAAVSLGSATVGGALLYICVTYDFKSILKEISQGSIAFLKSPGMVFYGGLLAGISGGIVTSKLLKLRLEEVEACAVPYIPLGHAVGRIGCLMAGCCYGLPYDGAFAVSTVFDASGLMRFPIQAVEALLDLVIMLLLLLYVKKKRRKYNTLLLYLIMYSALRFCLEFFRGDLIRGGFLFLSTSQWISLAIFLPTVTVQALKKHRNKPAPKRHAPTWPHS